MLIPEITLLAAGLGLLLALLSCLLVLTARRSMNAKMADLRFELQVHMSANLEMAKHIRLLQKNSQKMKQQQEYMHEDEEEELWHEPRPASSRQDSGRSGLSLAEKLGLSQSETDIITHLRPRNRRVQETA